MFPFSAPALSMLAIAAPESDSELEARAEAKDAELKRLYRRGLYKEALKAGEESLRLQMESNGDNDVLVAIRLNNLAEVHRTLGDHETAKGLYERALEILLATEGTESQMTAGIYNNLGLIAEVEGDLDVAMAYYERTLTILNKVVGDGYSGVAGAYNNMGSVAEAQGKYRVAQMRYEQALALRQKHLPPEHPMVAAAMGNLAALLYVKGDYVVSRELFDESIPHLEAGLGPDHPTLATFVGTLGQLVRAQGDDDRARLLLERSLAINERALGLDHPSVALTQRQLGEIYQLAGNAEAAAALYERSLRAFEAKLGPRHGRVATVLHSMASQELNAGRAEEARALGQRALDIKTEFYGAEHPSTALSLVTLALVDWKQGELERALARLERGTDIYVRTIGREHPQAIAQRGWLSGLLMDLGRHDEARHHSEQALAAAAAFFADVLAGLSEREALSYAGSLQVISWRHLAAHSRPEDQRRAWEGTLRWKGAVSRSLAGRRRMVSADSTLTEQFDELTRVRRTLSRLALSEPSEMGETALEARRAQLQQLREKKERIERSLGGMPNPELDVEALCAQIPPDGMLVDYLSHNSDETPRYTAFVVSPDCHVQRFELGTVEQIDPLIRDWREALDASTTEPTQRIDRRGERVYERLWAPLAQAVSGAKHILIAPDAATATVSFAALPTGDGYLLEGPRISYLESATDLTRWTDKPEGIGALLVGGVEYGGEDPSGTRSAPCLNRQFEALPGTQTEVDAIEAMWTRKQRGPVAVLTGTEAGEQAVVENMKGRQLIHLASHGFFAAGTCRSALANSQGVGFDPMLLSGVILAAANDDHPPLDPYDGILTAAEVATLRLEDTQLVVLSACETGLGEVHSGQGVLGLQRGFAEAGARTLVMSLWSVPDEATAALMADLYKQLLRRRSMSPPDALQRAQLAMLARNRRNGDARPGEWAAFVSAGDWR